MEKLLVLIIKYGGDKLLDTMFHYVNKCRDNRVAQWTKSLIIPFPKKGDIRNFSSYRTIILISHASKILLKILLEILNP